MHGKPWANCWMLLEDQPWKLALSIGTIYVSCLCERHGIACSKMDHGLSLLLVSLVNVAKPYQEVCGYIDLLYRHCVK